MTSDAHHGDALLERVNASLEAGTPPEGEDGEAELARATVEALCLLPYALEPQAPPERLRGAILAAARAETQSEAEAPAVAPPAPAAATFSTLRIERSWIPVALAALLAICVLGLGIFAAQLSARVGAQEKLIAELAHDLETSSDGARVAELERQLDDLSQRFRMITVTAAQVYSIRPQQAALERSNARGVMYTCSNHQRWYVNLQGLEPAPPGFEYHLWFLTERGPVGVRTFEVEPGRPAEMADQSMPAGTRGVAVSLEIADHSPAGAPSGPILLKGEDSMLLI